MDWNQITALPWWWEPFNSLAFALFATVAVPVLMAFVIGVAMFRRRVGEVYFAIITQASAAILRILIIGQQGHIGGVNGITDLRTLTGWDIRSDDAREVLYFVNGILLFTCLALAHYVRRSKLGRLLIAMRDQEDRVRVSGYDVASFKIFVFCLGAAFASIGGAMFTLQVGFTSPTLVGIVPSIEMVIFRAVGGRLSILGAVYGALLVTWAKTALSEGFPELWLLGLGGLFIAVVPFFSNGPAGLRNDHVAPRPTRKLPAPEPLARPAPDDPPAPEPNPHSPLPPKTQPAAGRRDREHEHSQSQLRPDGGGAHRLLRRLRGGGWPQLLCRSQRMPRHHRP
jgi:urea transport system permease protein